MITAHAIPILSDNYAWLLRCSVTGATAIVDPAEEAPIVRAIDAHGGRLDMILITHHHGDHIASVDQIRARFPAPVVGAAADARRLPRLDRAVVEGDTVTLGACSATVIDTPGHTQGHIAYHFADGGILLSGDTLFSLGCGRLSEAGPAEMFASLAKFAKLPHGAKGDTPGDTWVCCGHEYTESNLQFALSVDPDNVALLAFGKTVVDRRAAGLATVPSKLSDEMECNPFLRAPDVATLGKLREQKNNF